MGSSLLGVMASDAQLARAMRHLLSSRCDAVRRAAEAALDRVVAESARGPWSVQQLRDLIVERLLWAGEHVRRGADVEVWAENVLDFVRLLATDARAGGRLDQDEVEHVVSTDVQGKTRRIAFATESGLFALILRAVRVCARRPGAPGTRGETGSRVEVLLELLTAIGIRTSATALSKAIERHAFESEDLADLDELHRITDSHPPR